MLVKFVEVRYDDDLRSLYEAVASCKKKSKSKKDVEKDYKDKKKKKCKEVIGGSSKCRVK